METIHTKYLGNLRTEAVHLKSKNVIITDAPPDNHGRGEAFSPTDLMSASLGSCMITLMGIKANEHKIGLEGLSLRITKMMAENPRRVAEIIVDVDMPKSVFSEKEKTILEHTAINCPVAKSLHPDLKQTIRFNY